MACYRPIFKITESSSGCRLFEPYSYMLYSSDGMRGWIVYGAVVVSVYYVGHSVATNTGNFMFLVTGNN